MVRIHEFDPVLYPVKLWVAVTDDVEGIHERLEDMRGNRLNIEDTSYSIATTFQARMKEDRKQGVLIVFYNIKDMVIKHVAHECTHGADFMWDMLGEQRVGIEANAYLVGWMAECCEIVKKEEENG